MKSARVKPMVCICAVLLLLDLCAQNVGINADGSDPNPNAALDIESPSTGNGKGLLIPRVTELQRTNASTNTPGGLLNDAGQLRGGAAQGLLVYQTDGKQGFYYNTSTGTTPAWVFLGSGEGTGTVTSITVNGPLTGGTITTTGNIGISKADGSTNGYLSKEDWTTFNGKSSLQLGETAATAFRGDSGKTAYDERLRWDGSSTSLNATTGRASLGLGDAATRNVGTTASTVAAGDDSRLVEVTNATDANTTGAIVKRDSSGNFSAGTVTVGGVKLATGAGSGKVLTSDGSGLASWQAAASVPASGIVLSETNPNASLSGYTYLGRITGEIKEASKAWMPTSLLGAPEKREKPASVWTGTEMIVWGGYNGSNVLNSGGRYNPLSDSWIEVNPTGAPSGRIYHTVVWTGTEMLVWGGLQDPTYLNTGAKYNPTTDTWTAITTTNAPSGRARHTAVWTGTEMLIWGGYSGGGNLNDGAKYNPTTNTWTPITTTNAPSARYAHTAVWTGSQMIVWGGYSGGDLNTGGAYTPGSDTWSTVTTTNAPSARSTHTAVWTGTEMIVWGGQNTGGKYNPGSDSWTATTTTGAPSARSRHIAVWTGTEMIVWGGSDGSCLRTGGKYTPGTDSWSATTLVGAPSARQYHTAVWTDSDGLIVWGGWDTSYTASGGKDTVYRKQALYMFKKD